MWRRPACQTLSALNISSATAWVAPDLLKTLAILSYTTVRRCAVDQKDKNHTGNQKKSHICQGNSTTYKFFKDFTNHKKKTNRVIDFSCRPFSNILNTGTTNETFQKSGKQDSFRHLKKSLASM